MSECQQCEPLLASYVDGAAPPRDRERIEKHVESCACCRDWLSRERAAHEALHARRAGLRACASEHLKARCAAYAAQKSHTSKTPVARFSPRSGASPSLVRRWAPMSAAAALVLAVAGVFGIGLMNEAQALALQTTVDHVKCSRFNVPAGTADPLTSSQQWQTRFGWPLRLPDSAKEAEAGLQLRTVRRCAVTDGRVAHLIYTWMGETLSVYVLPKRTLGDEAQFVRRFQHETVSWSKGDRTYIIVSPRPRDAALDRVTAYVRAAAY